MDTSGLDLLASVCCFVSERDTTNIPFEKLVRDCSREIEKTKTKRKPAPKRKSPKVAEKKFKKTRMVSTSGGSKEDPLQEDDSTITEGQQIKDPLKGTLVKRLKDIEILPKHLPEEIDGYVYFGRNRSRMAKEDYRKLITVLASSTITGTMSNAHPDHDPRIRLNTAIVEDCYILLYLKNGITARAFCQEARTLCSDERKKYLRILEAEGRDCCG